MSVISAVNSGLFGGGSGGNQSLAEVLLVGATASTAIEMDFEDINNAGTVSCLALLNVVGEDLVINSDSGLSSATAGTMMLLSQGNAVYGSNVGTTAVSANGLIIFDSNTGFNFSSYSGLAPILLNGDAGLANQSLMSGGAGLANFWGTGGGGSVGTLAEVLTNGAVANMDIDLNDYVITNCASINSASGASVSMLAETCSLECSSNGDITILCEGGLDINGDYGNAGDVLTSNGVDPPTWEAGGAGGVGSLSEVLAVGNMADGTIGINMNGSSISGIYETTTVLLNTNNFFNTAGGDISLYANGVAGINLNSTSQINLNTGSGYPLLINGDAGTAGYVLTSNGTVGCATWQEGAGGPTPTLAEVLTAGATADTVSIDMNMQNINNITTISAVVLEGLAINNGDIAVTSITGGGVILNSSGSIYLNFAQAEGGFGSLLLDQDAGTAGYVLTSNGVAVPPTWEAAGAGGVGTLDQVLSNGNSAGGNDIDLNGQSIINGNQVWSSIFFGNPDINDGTVELTATGTGEVVITSNNIINLVMGGDLQLNGIAGPAGYVLTSNGSTVPPTWEAGGAGSVPTIEEVLNTGNIAGSGAILDMNLGNIENVTDFYVKNINSYLEYGDITLVTTTNGDIEDGDIILASAGNIWLQQGIAGALYVGENGSATAGTAGQAIISNGPLLPATWGDITTTLDAVLAQGNVSYSYDIEMSNNNIFGVNSLFGSYFNAQADGEDLSIQTTVAGDTIGNIELSSAGSIGLISNALDISLTTANNLVLSIVNGFFINGSSGSLGQVLTSTGGGGAGGTSGGASWTTPANIPALVLIPYTPVSPTGLTTITVSVGVSQVIPVGSYFCHYYVMINSGTAGKLETVTITYSLNGGDAVGAVTQASSDTDSCWMTGSYYFSNPIDGGDFNLFATVQLQTNCGCVLNPNDETSNFYALFQVSETP